MSELSSCRRVFVVLLALAALFPTASRLSYCQDSDNRSLAAQKLKISRKTLYNKLRQYNLD